MVNGTPASSDRLLLPLILHRLWCPGNSGANWPVPSQRRPAILAAPVPAGTSSCPCFPVVHLNPLPCPFGSRPFLSPDPPSPVQSPAAAYPGPPAPAARCPCPRRSPPGDQTDFADLHQLQHRQKGDHHLQLVRAAPSSSWRKLNLPVFPGIAKHRDPTSAPGSPAPAGWCRNCCGSDRPCPPCASSPARTPASVWPG